MWYSGRLACSSGCRCPGPGRCRGSWPPDRGWPVRCPPAGRGHTRPAPGRRKPPGRRDRRHRQAPSPTGCGHAPSRGGAAHRWSRSPWSTRSPGSGPGGMQRSPPPPSPRQSRRDRHRCPRRRPPCGPPPPARRPSGCETPPRRSSRPAGRPRSPCGSPQPAATAPHLEILRIDGGGVVALRSHPILGGRLKPGLRRALEPGLLEVGCMVLRQGKAHKKEPLSSFFCPILP